MDDQNRPQGPPGNKPPAEKRKVISVPSDPLTPAHSPVFFHGAGPGGAGGKLRVNPHPPPPPKQLPRPTAEQVQFANTLNDHDRLYVLIVFRKGVAFEMEPADWIGMQHQQMQKIRDELVQR